MKKEIIGRENETNILAKAFVRKDPQLIAVYGRRRIGKTHLIREFYSDKGLYIQFTGVLDASTSDQLANFHDEFSSIFTENALTKPPKSWREAFKSLAQSVKEVAKNKRVIIFFDEVPWLANHSGFLKALEYSWNQHFTRIQGIIIVLCGSTSSWMIRKIIQNKGGLHGRLTTKLHLQPFTLLQTERFLQSLDVRLSRLQIVELYMSLGGVAQYLKAVPPGKSSAQAIQELCFSPQGLLFREFYPLFRSLFKHSEKYVSIVQALASHRKGVTKHELLALTKMSSGGSSTQVLQELEESGFIAYVPDFGKAKKGGKYRLIDEYSLFYQFWIQNAANSIITMTDLHYWQREQLSHRWSVWAGYAFENLCYRHISQIKQALGLAAVSTIDSSWQSKVKEHEGAEIDLVIDRRDQCINLCEIKFYSKELSIDRKLAETLERKKTLFRAITGAKKSLFITLITMHGVKESGYYGQIVDSQLTLNDLFY